MRRAAAAALLVALAGCGYSPNPVEGKLLCNPGDGPKCPEGYFCRSDLTCWKSTPGDLYVGTWTFTVGTRDGTCDGGPHQNESVVDEMVTIDYTTAPGRLTASYYCDWLVNVSGPGSSTMMMPGQTCSAVDPSTNTQYQYQGTSLGFITKNGTTATLTAALSFGYRNTDGTTGTCDLKISGSLSKTGP